MKKCFLIIIAAIIMVAPFLSFGQREEKTEEKTKPVMKISYSFINEYGTFAGGSIGFTGVFVNGISLNKTHLIGIGMGYEADTRAGQSMPIYVNYRYYFKGKKQFNPLINVGLGTRLTFSKSTYYSDPWENMYGYSTKLSVEQGFYCTAAGGFRVKAFTFTSGGFVKSIGDDFYAGVEIKAGFTF
jgi:hypothetical protein